jgi:cystathionine beta-lyase/cystathionine gamma-synthase
MASSSNPNEPDPTPPKPTCSLAYSLSTLGVHADDPINASTDVAPALHVSTTYRYTSDPDKLIPVSDLDFGSREPGRPIASDAHIYSRVTTPNTSRLELLLTEIIGQPVLTYSSGLAAFHALLVYLHPRVVAIGGGYHGCHGVLAIYQKLTNCKIVDLHDEKTWSGDDFSLGEGDVVHLETPVNPHGTAFDIAAFAERAHSRGAILTVDATFAPPPLCDPFRWGADFVMHSGTKYFGGHSDMLCGVIAIGRESQGRPNGSESWQKDYWTMFGERLHLGGVMGSLEGWLGVRSLRTLELRVVRQSQSADRLVAWLDRGLNETKSGDEAIPEEAEVIKTTVKSIQHASLQREDFSWLKQQMPNGFGPVFSITLHSKKMAQHFPSKLHLFHHATSLGGVESLIEWRRMSDQTVEPEVLRLSIGVENWEDLKADILQGLHAIASMKE